MAERIAKFIARAGVCSRRKAEELILQERVKVNGETITSPAFNVNGDEKILIDGEKISQAGDVRVWLYYKPLGLITTHNDEKGRPTVFQNLPEDMPRVISVGRLDLNSEGLLLLTNSGELSRQLELPENGWSRRYKVKVHGKIVKSKIEDIEKGITFEGIKYSPAKVDMDIEKGTNYWLTITLKEGKNREIRNLMKYAGLEVARLIRISYGPFQLGSMKKGEVREVNKKTLKEQLGSKFKI